MSESRFGLANAKGLHMSDILYLIREGGATDDEPLLAHTPHGTYTFVVALADVTEEGRIVLGLRPVKEDQ